VGEGARSLTPRDPGMPIKSSRERNYASWRKWRGKGKRKEKRVFWGAKVGKKVFEPGEKRGRP